MRNRVSMKKQQKGDEKMEELEAYEEMMEEEMVFQNERNEKEEELWAHDPDTGERTFYLGCLI